MHPSRDGATEGKKRILELASVRLRVIGGQIHMHRSRLRITPHPLNESADGRVPTHGFYLRKTREINHDVLLTATKCGGVRGECAHALE